MKMFLLKQEWESYKGIAYNLENRCIRELIITHRFLFKSFSGIEGYVISVNPYIFNWLFNCKFDFEDIIRCEYYGLGFIEPKNNANFGLYFTTNKTQTIRLYDSFDDDFYQPCEQSITESSYLEELLTGHSSWEEWESEERFESREYVTLEQAYLCPLA